MEINVFGSNVSTSPLDISEDHLLIAQPPMWTNCCLRKNIFVMLLKITLVCVEINVFGSNVLWIYRKIIFSLLNHQPASLLKTARHQDRGTYRNALIKFLTSENDCDIFQGVPLCFAKLAKLWVPI